MSKIDEVKKILYAVRSRDCSVSRGAFTICQLFKPDESLLLSDKEIREIAGHYHFFSNTMSLKKDYGEMIAKAQLAKDEARHEADKVKVREQTLKEVGEWLYSLCPHTTDPLQQRKLCRLCVSTLAEELFWGRMP